MSHSPLRIAVFASGTGSNLEAILEAIEAGTLEGAEVAAVISDKPAAKALERARQRSIATAVLPPRDFAR